MAPSRNGTQGYTCERAAVLKWNQLTSVRAGQRVVQEWLTAQSAHAHFYYAAPAVVEIPKEDFLVNEEKLRIEVSFYCEYHKSTTLLKENYKHYMHI